MPDQVGAWIIVVILAVRPSDSEFNNSSNEQNTEYFGAHGIFVSVGSCGIKISYVDRMNNFNIYGVIILSKRY